MLHLLILSPTTLSNAGLSRVAGAGSIGQFIKANY